jgi:hypothetical protein
LGGASQGGRDCALPEKVDKGDESLRQSLQWIDPAQQVPATILLPRLSVTRKQYQKAVEKIIALNQAHQCRYMDHIPLQGVSLVTYIWLRLLRILAVLISSVMADATNVIFQAVPKAWWW